MGGFILPSTTIGGTVLSPGIPLEGAPLSGLYELPGLAGAGFAINSVAYNTLGAFNYTLGPQPASIFTMSAVAGAPFVAGNGTVDSAISPDGLHVYAANFNAGTISVYSRNAVTGGLTPVAGSPFATGANPSGVVVSPDGTHLLVCSTTNNAIYVYSRNVLNGSLTAIAGSPFVAGLGINPQHMAISNDGLHVYTSNQGAGTPTVSSLIRNPITGLLTAAAGSPFASANSSQGVAVSPNGLWVFVTNYNTGNVSVYACALATGVLTQVPGSPFVTGALAYAVTVSPDNAHVIITNFGGASLAVFSLNKDTGFLTPVQGSPFAVGVNAASVVISSGGDYIFVPNSTGNTVSIFARNKITGFLTPVVGSPFAVAGGAPCSATLSPDNAFLYVGNYAGNVGALATSVIPTFPLVTAFFDLLGNRNGSLNIYGALNLNGQPVMSAPSTIGSAGKFLRVDGAGVTTLWDGVNTSIPAALVANAAALAVDDSGNYLIDLSGVLTAQGVLTITHAVPANATLFIFDNATTGAFPLITAGTLGVFNIPRGKSLWYWNGATCEYVSSGGFDSVNVTPLPAAGVAIATPHFMGVTPSWVTLEAICLTAELGYAIGDVVNVVCQATAGLALSPLSFYKDTTIVGFTLIALNQIAIMNAATGVYAIPTAANWAYRFGIDR